MATAMSVWKDSDRAPVDDWISGGTRVPQYRPIRGPTENTRQEGGHPVSHRAETTDTQRRIEGGKKNNPLVAKFSR